MPFIDRSLEEYIELHSTPESEVLKKLNRETYAKILRPRMLSGHIQGKFLEMITQMIDPSNVLEIGTYTGYSAIAIAEGLSENAKLITTEINEELEDIANRYFSESGLANKIELIIGNAIDIIPSLHCEFQFVFIDADKENYIEYFELVLPKVPKGGFILADNVLWSGKVLTEPHRNDKDTIAIKKFNKYVNNDQRVENVILPFRDGITLIRKL